MSKYPIPEVINALRAHHGLLVFAAEALGCARQTLYNYAERYPEVAEVLAEERERVVDLAEQGLYYHLEEKAPWAISFVLKSVGRQRGYIDPTTARGVGIPGQDHDARDWPHIQYILLRALEGYPEARAAVVAALKAAESHESTNRHPSLS
jgi:hypothetical protein